jgi:acetamidase/formamidase
MATVEGTKYAGKVHYLSDDVRHFKWDNSLAPALTVDSGDIVTIKCREGADGQFTPESTVDDMKNLDWNRIHSLTGPIAVRGAEPGDALAVDILDFDHEGWGFTVFHPYGGILVDDFGDTWALKIWTVDEDGRAELVPGVRVPIDPFCGVMGVAPAEPGQHSTMPPRPVGGNIDIRHLKKGSTAFFPIEVPDALFSVGDCHLAQGDGEVCSTAIEAPLTVTVRLTLQKGRNLPSVQYLTPPGSTTAKYESEGYFATTAMGLDLHENVCVAVRSMIDWLEAEHGLSRVDGYFLCSVAGDLKIAVPVVQEGHQACVCFHMPLNVFVGGSRA